MVLLHLLVYYVVAACLCFFIFIIMIATIMTLQQFSGFLCRWQKGQIFVVVKSFSYKGVVRFKRQWSMFAICLLNYIIVVTRLTNFSI